MDNEDTSLLSTLKVGCCPSFRQPLPAHVYIPVSTFCPPSLRPASPRFPRRRRSALDTTPHYPLIPRSPATQRPRTYSHARTRVPSAPRTCSRPSESMHARSAANHIHARASPEDRAQAFILMAQTRCGEYICICFHSRHTIPLCSQRCKRTMGLRRGPDNASIVESTSFYRLLHLMVSSSHFSCATAAQVVWQLVELQLTVLCRYLCHSGALRETTHTFAHVHLGKMLFIMDSFRYRAFNIYAVD